MTSSARLVLLATIAALVSSSAPRHAHAGGSSTIVLEVSTFRNLKGFLGCQLYATADSFPDKWQTQVNLRKHVPVTAATTSCTFADLAPGTYAAAVIHDENGNGTLDKNFLGIPTEAYGISNNHTHALSKPTWDESKFTVNADTTVTSKISLRY
jgi:uncharacterized protein (DUF2141 family)